MRYIQKHTMEPLKNMYNTATLAKMALALKSASGKFDEKNFKVLATRGLSSLEMKARVVQVGHALHQTLPGTYAQKVKILLMSLQSKSNPQGLQGFLLWPYSYFIEIYGVDDFKTSMRALYEITQRFTSEWGVRPFFERYPDQVYALFAQWVKDPNEHVRRWVSEGLRPNLPWGMNISHLKNNLSRNLKLLEHLKKDDSLYVRKSVANHLNDIAALDADLLLQTAKLWKDETPNMQRLLQQALRNLLKQGHPQALGILGYNSKAKTQVNHFKLSKKRIHEGDHIDIVFEVINESKVPQALMIDYIVHYVKSSGKSSPKVFKLKNTRLKPNESLKVFKKQSFKAVSTRKHYSGDHLVEVQINGVIKAGQTVYLQV